MRSRTLSRPLTSDMVTDIKTCPRCAEEVRGAAAVCRHCGYQFFVQTTGNESVNRGMHLALLVSGAVIALATFLPWIEVSSSLGFYSFNGLASTSRIGIWTLGLGGLIGGLGGVGLYSSLSRPLALLTAFAGVAAASIGYLHATDVKGTLEATNRSTGGFLEQTFISPTIGNGIWLLVFASLVAVVAGVALSSRTT